MLKILKPTTLQERIELLDCVRGFSLTGICIANLVSFAGLYVMAPEQVTGLPWPDAGRLTLFVIDWLIEGKFYTLFSVLFGIGFGLQLARAGSTSVPFAGFWLRRMAALCLFGLIHMFFIWYGDILTLYSFMGVLLLGFRTVSSKRLLCWVAVLFVAPLLIQAVLFVSADHPFWQSLAQMKTQLQNRWGFDGRTLFEMRSSTNYAEILASNVLNAITRPMSYLQSGRPFQVLGQFLLGLWIAREILPRIREAPLDFNRCLLPLALFALAASAVYASIKAYTGLPISPGTLGLIQSAAYHSGSTLLALCYLTLIAYAWQSPIWRRTLQWLTPLGRMPLTSYISQSLIALCLFYGYGLAWMGRCPIVVLIPLTLSIIVLQRSLCAWWLARRPQGPLEQLWRSLSYRSYPAFKPAALL